MIRINADDLDLSDWIRPGDMVVWGQACAEPTELTAALLANRARLGPLRCFIGVVAPGTALRLEHADVVRFYSYIGSGINGELAGIGALDIVPCNYSALPEVLSSGPLRADVTLLLVSPENGRGEYSLGLAADYLLDAVRASRVVIAVASDAVPWTAGAALKAHDIDVLVPSACAPPWSPTNVSESASERRIAQHVAGLVEDGATLQAGIGRLPAAVLYALRDHRNLGVHSGIITDAVVDLIEAGAVDNSQKSLDRGRSVAAFAVGGPRIAAFLHENPAVELREARYTHDPQVLGAQHRLVALNSALEVDLTGQVNAEAVKNRYVGGVGGGPEFLRGAARSPGGLPITMLESVGRTGSRIVVRLSGPVTVPRSDAGIVVTEHGVADLRGATLRERAERMLAVADPARRERLQAETETLP